VKHSELDWPLGTEATPEQENWFREWNIDVDEAISSNNSEVLAELFHELTLIFDDQQASTIWLSRMSGWDASAVTG